MQAQVLCRESQCLRPWGWELTFAFPEFGVKLPSRIVLSGVPALARRLPLGQKLLEGPSKELEGSRTQSNEFMLLLTEKGLSAKLTFVCLTKARAWGQTPVGRLPAITRRN